MNNSKAVKEEEEIVTVEEGGCDRRGRVVGRERRCNGGRAGCGTAKKPENSKSQDGGRQTRRMS